jgi:SAM-dependent methyltransferase
MPTPRSQDTLDLYDWLLSDDGAALLTDIGAHLAAGDTVLRISETLRRDHAPELVALALTQVQLRQQAKAKFAHADRLFFTREGLEQATSDRISAWRAGRFATFGRIVDLCCGIGGDLMALAALPHPHELTAGDIDPVHLMLASRNARTIAPAQAISTVLDDVRNASIEPDAAVFIDPARRDARGRLGGVISEPPLEWAIALAARAAAVGIKTAPGIPHELVPDNWEMETIALDADLKEAVLWSPAVARTRRSATVITGDAVHRLEPVAGEPVGLREPRAGSWLLDPNPAVTRAGLVEDLARLVGAEKIDEEIGFLVTDHPVASPFARALPIIDSLPWHEKRLKARLKEFGAGPVDIRRRGLAGDVAAITKRLRGNGSRRITLAMTRHRGEPWAVICDGV